MLIEILLLKWFNDGWFNKSFGYIKWGAKESKSEELKSQSRGAVFAIKDKVPFLKRLGVEVTIDLNQEESFSGYNLIQILQLIHDC